MSKRYLYILSLSLTLFTSAIALRATEVIQSRTVKIPSPAELAKRAESLSPEEISQLEIDDVLRDRLRADPQWREIADAVRQEIIIKKWGDSAPANPVWQRYGAKAYPLLSYYARSRDRVRQEYGIEGIRSLGKPYTTLWLRGHIAKGLNYPQIYDIIPYTSSSDKSWEKEFGLDDPKVRREIIALAKANLKPKSDPQYYDQFNLGFLSQLLGYEAVYGKSTSQPDLSLAGLPKWVALEKLNQPTAPQVQAAIAFYRQLPKEARSHILVQRLGAIKAGQIHPFGLAFFRALAQEATTANSADPFEQIWAIAELERHGDAIGTNLLTNILNDDLSQLHPLAKIVSYENYDQTGSHAYYLLLGMVEKYPQSKFARACREYGDLTGRSYFDAQERSPEILARNARRSPQDKLKAWQEWLERYDNHSGADDAHYFLGISLQQNNDPMAAMRVWIKMMTSPMGDRDAIYLAFPHVRTLLDVGLSIEQMQLLLTEINQTTINQNPASPSNAKVLAPFFNYAIAVNYARKHNYEQALIFANQVQIEAIPDRILEDYYHPQGKAWAEDNRVAEFKQESQALLQEQKGRWQQLRQWQLENTPTAQYQIAANWSGIGGWKNGYLPIWGGIRAYLLPTDWNCQRWWVCDRSLRRNSDILAAYQGGSQNAIALSLYQNLLDSNQLPPDLREKSLYMIAMILLEQWENHTFSETTSIHPPAGVQSSSSFRQTLKPIFSYLDYQNLETNIAQDYQRRIDSIITELQLKFPQSIYTDDLLFSSFFLSDRRTYLERLLASYPKSDRAAEAKFLLNLKKTR